MTEDVPPPEAEPEGTPSPMWSTGVLWGILAILLVVGTLGAALFVFALTVWILSGVIVLGAIAAVIGGVIAFLSFLFMAGILYRVDRYRGVPHKEVRLFE